MTKRRIDAGEAPETDDEMLEPDAPVDEYDEEDEADEVALANAVSELGESGGSGKVVVHKENSARQDVYINTYDIGIFNGMGLNGLRSEYGPGTYRIRVYNGRGKLVKGGNKKIMMAQIEQEKPKSAAPDISAVLAAAMQTMQQNMEQSIARLAEAMRPPPAPTMGEMLQNMVYMKQVMGMDAPRNDGGIDMFLKAVQVAREISPPSGEATGADVFLELAKQFAPVIAQNAHRGAQQVPRTQVAAAPPPPSRQIAPGPIPAPAPVPAPEVQPAPQESDDMGLMFKMQLQMMVNAARMNSPPENYVDMILDNFDDETLTEFLDDPNAIQKLSEINPSVISVSEWFSKLRAALKQAIDESGEADSADDGLTIPPFPESNEGHE